MLELVSRDDIRRWTTNRRQHQQTAALVPTMGNLHSGHLSLIEIARRHADLTVASIFVNPTQFGKGEDYSNYPRTLERDRQLLANAGCDVLLLPVPETLYPYGSDDYTRVQAPVGLADILCGASRPGHFDGVLSVVSRLFNLIQPEAAVFGEKDYQQLLVIRRMVADLGMPQQVIAGPTMRDASGLAMSSRNQYLDDAARQQAAQLHAELQNIADQLDAGRRDFDALEREAQERLRQSGFQPDYVSIRHADSLDAATADDLSGNYRILTAARLNGTRLIDNIAWPRQEAAHQ